MGVKAEDFAVKVIRTERVAPKQPWHDHWLPFTNLDLLVPPFDVGSFFCYKKSHDQSVDATTLVHALKTSLSDALTLFYPLAGEIVRNAAGEPEIHCNNKGVEFVEAVADVKLEELDFHNPDLSMERKLMPKRCYGVLATQVTMLKCGGMVISTIIDHRVADGYSANMFVSSWADMTRSQTPSFLPSFRRSVLNARRPTFYTPLVAHLFVPLTNLPCLNLDLKSEPCLDQDLLISRIYYVEGRELKKLQLLASENGCQRSKLESFTSFLWKITATFMEDSGHHAQICNIAVAVDGRRRLCEGEGVEKEEHMVAHFGNVLSIPFGRIQSKDLKVMPFSSVANEVHKFLKSAANKEHFLELIDWVEDQRPKPLISRPFAGTEKAVSIMVSSGQRFSIMDKMDFGWGKLVFGSCYVPGTRTDCYVMTMASPVKEDDWIVYMHLPRNHLNYMETHASHLFKPLTSGYLKVTMLKCGGMVISTIIDHRVADGYSANMFVSSWADMTRSQTPSFLPSFHRSVLNARRPTFYTPSVAHLFVSLTNLPCLNLDLKSEPCLDQDLLISRIYYVEGRELKKLQLLASENGCQRSKLESFTSLLWKITATFMEDSGHHAQICNIAVAVDGRRRLCEREEVEKEEHMVAHFGNVLSIPFGRIQSKDLKVMPLSSVANEVHKFLKGAANKEHFLELIDWVEDQRPKPLISRPFARTEKAVSIMVSSGQRLSIMDKMDFGWGKLVFGSCYVPATRTDCYVMTMGSPVKEDDWIVYMYLPMNHLNYMETHASHLFKPLTSGYLKL